MGSQILQGRPRPAALLWTPLSGIPTRFPPSSALRFNPLPTHATPFRHINVLRKRNPGRPVVVASSSTTTSNAVWDSWLPDNASKSPSLSDVVWPSLGAFAAMAMLGKIDQLLAPKGISMTIAPLGAVCAVLFLTPSSPAAKVGIIDHVGKVCNPISHAITGAKNMCEQNFANPSYERTDVRYDKFDLPWTFHTLTKVIDDDEGVAFNDELVDIQLLCTYNPSSECQGFRHLGRLISNCFPPNCQNCTTVVAYDEPNRAVSKYNMFMAQIGCAAIGVLAYTFLGPGWLARSVSLAVSIAFMVYTQCTHPPAASLPLLFIDGAKLHNLNYWYVLFPGAAACIILSLLQEVVCYFKSNFKF